MVEARTKMRFISPLISEARNKIGGLVYAANSTSQYARAYKLPSQPRSAPQQFGRSLFASIAAAWPAESQPTRDAWNAYANRTFEADTLGQQRRLSGFQWYVRCRLNMLYHGDSTPCVPDFLGAAPINLDLGITGALLYGAGLFALTIVSEAGYDIAAMNLSMQATAPLSTGVNFFPRQLFRRLIPPYPLLFSQVDLGPAYVSRYGLPPLGSRIAVRGTALLNQSGTVTKFTHAYIEVA
jgi:hypothetical protein